MKLFPKSHSTYEIRDIYDDEGRVIIPNAVFYVTHQYRMMGIGKINQQSDSSVVRIESSYIINMGGDCYVGKFYPCLMSVNSTFATRVDVVEQGVFPWREFNFSSTGVAGTCFFESPDSKLFVMAEYERKVSSSELGGKCYAFITSPYNPGMLKKIPLPNTFEDGAFCIGKQGVKFDELPAPEVLIDAVHTSIMKDNYNMDLFKDHVRFDLDKDGNYTLKKNFMELKTFVNERLSNIIVQTNLS